MGRRKCNEGIGKYLWEIREMGLYLLKCECDTDTDRSQAQLGINSFRWRAEQNPIAAI